MSATDYKAYTLSVNDIKRANVEIGDRAIAIQIVRLCIMQRGTNSLFPDMGVGLPTLCRGKTEKDLDDISKVINQQIISYLPKYRFASVSLRMGDTNHTLIIDIKVNDTVYMYDTATSPTPIVLNDLKSN